MTAIAAQKIEIDIEKAGSVSGLMTGKPKLQ